MTFKKKTVSSEAIVGSAAITLNRAVTAAQEAITKLATLSSEAEDKQFAIAELEAKTAELTVQFNEKKRAGQVEVDLEIKAYKLDAAKTIATANGFVLVDAEVNNKLRDDYNKLVTDFDKKVATDTNIKLGFIQKDYDNRIALAEANAKAAAAQLNSDLVTARGQIKFLEEQIVMWKGQLEAERNAGVSRAQAGAVGTINLSAPGK